MPIDIIKSLLEQATGTGSRSTVLTDLRWALAILAALLLGTLKIATPAWVPILCAGMLCATLLLYGWAYIYFAAKNPDALRSEKYTLSKMAIERSVTGDNLTGFSDPMLQGTNAQSLPASTPPDAQP